MVVAWCLAHDEPQIAHAISAHGSTWGVPHTSTMDQPLLAADEATGFVVACGRVHLAGLRGLTVESVLKKLRSKSFAAGCSRSEMEAGAALIGW